MSQPERAENIRSTEQPQQVRWAGVDWSWSEHAVCVIDDDGAVIARFTVAHTKAGFATLVTTLDRHDVSGVATERGDGPVVAALLEAGLTVFVIASRQVTALRARYSVAGNKDDRFDAYLLADVLRTDRRRLTPLDTDTDATVGLRMLVRPAPSWSRPASPRTTSCGRTCSWPTPGRGRAGSASSTARSRWRS